MPFRAALALTLLALAACAEPLTDDSTQVTVGFLDAVDAALIASVGGEILDSASTPPIARVRLPRGRVERLRYAAGVAFLVGDAEPDSLVAIVGFVDRPAPEDTLSTADRAAVAAAGGRFRSVSPNSRMASVMVPSEGMVPLYSDPRVDFLEHTLAFAY